MRIINTFGDQQFRAEQGNIADQGFVLQWFHANFGTVRQNICAGKRFSKSVLIGKIGDGNDAIGVFIHPLRKGNRFFEKVIFTVKQFNFLNAFNGCLGANGGSRASRAEQHHGFSPNIETAFFNCPNMARTIRVVAA